MNAQDLKNSILQLAVQGKLVEQRPEEGTARELLEQIRAEKEQLVKEKKTKKSKPLPDIMEDEIPFEIPESWEWVRLVDIVEFRIGKTPPRGDEAYWGGDYKWVSISDMIDGTVIKDTKETVSDRAIKEKFKYIVPKGTMLMSFKLTVGKVSILGFDAVHNEAIVSIYPFIDSNYNMRNYLFKILPYMSVFGKTKKAIMGFTLNSDSLSRLLIPLPPLAEQHRIVAKIEEIIPYIEQYDKAYTKLETLNKKFPDDMKKSILQLAMQGKLVEQRPEEGTADELYEQIVAEKERLIKEGKIKKEKPLPEITDEEIPFEIPDSWKWVRFGEFGSYKKGPFGSALTKAIFVAKGKDTIKVYEQKNAIKKDASLGEYYITREYFENKMKGFELFPGDIIVSCAGTIGETYIMPDGIEKGIINQALMRMRLMPSVYVKYFLLYFDVILKQTARKSSKGSAIKNIPPFDVLKAYLVPLPPLDEQKRIVARIEELLPYCDRLDR